MQTRLSVQYLQKQPLRSKLQQFVRFQMTSPDRWHTGTRRNSQTRKTTGIRQNKWHWGDKIYWTYLPHINCHLTALSDYARGIGPFHPFLQVGQNFRCGYSSKSFGSFMSDHIRFICVLQNGEKWRNSVRREQLPEDECNLVPRTQLY